MQVQILRGSGGVKSLPLANLKQIETYWVLRVLSVIWTVSAKHYAVCTNGSRERLILHGMYWSLVVCVFGLGESSTCIQNSSLLRRLLEGKTPSFCAWVVESGDIWVSGHFNLEHYNILVGMWVLTFGWGFFLFLFFLWFFFPLAALTNPLMGKKTSIQILQAPKYLIWLPATTLMKPYRVWHRLKFLLFD